MTFYSDARSGATAPPPAPRWGDANEANRPYLFGFGSGRLANFAQAFLVLLLTNAFVFFLVGFDPNAATQMDTTTTRQVVANSNSLFVYVRLGVLTLFAAPLLWHRVGIATASSRAAPVWAFALWMVISTSWSDIPEASLRAALVACVPMIAGLSLSSRYPPSRTISIILLAGALSLAASLLYVVLIPSQGTHTNAGHFGRWRGVYDHKNGFGHLMALLFVVFASTGRSVVNSRWTYYAIVFLFAVAVVFSGSASALSLSMLGLAAFVVIFKTYGRLRLVALLLAPMFVFIATTGLESVAALLGRDPTLTGRTDVWAMSLRFLSERWVTGFGYASTYGGLIRGLFATFAIDHPHNGYIDLMLGTGVIGLITFVVAIYWAFRAAYRAGAAGVISQATQRSGVMILICWLISAGTESALRPTTPIGAIGLVTLAAMASWPAPRRPATGPGVRR